MAIREARHHDLDLLQKEAELVGFLHARMNLFQDNTCVEVYLTPTLILFKGGNWKYDADAVKSQIYGTYIQLTELHIEEIGLLMSQVRFLEWSAAWERDIEQYWKNQTQFENIEEFTEHQKQNAERIYGSSPDVKFANKS